MIASWMVPDESVMAGAALHGRWRSGSWGKGFGDVVTQSSLSAKRMGRRITGRMVEG
jgi:hypothetical protein